MGGGAVIEFVKIKPGDDLPCPRTHILETNQLSAITNDKILGVWYIDPGGGDSA